MGLVVGKAVYKMEFIVLSGEKGQKLLSSRFMCTLQNNIPVKSTDLIFFFKTT